MTGTRRHEREDRDSSLGVLKDRRLAFLVVGGFNTALGWALFALAQHLVGAHLGRFGYMVSLYLSYTVGVFLSYLTQRALVFRPRGHFWLDLARFSLVQIGGLALNSVLLPVIIEATSATPLVAQGFATITVAVITYLAHSRFSFRRGRTAEPSDSRRIDPARPPSTQENL
ncbi:GtrA family protein [Xylanimonas ulmi]|uniref:Putative flippase GtrA n=1 Tax=Xylanimonas ulmi TaxID=228973 RepID=A0A4V2EXL9_9MICO|nr:GtrA family protein [Xylanibacterium ulmi]RZS59950.1 putative flippase GtrA [Xylanibacterium ulmi]